jgi:hypothetical protein
MTVDFIRKHKSVMYYFIVILSIFNSSWSPQQTQDREQQHVYIVLALGKNMQTKDYK